MLGGERDGSLDGGRHDGGGQGGVGAGGVDNFLDAEFLVVVDRGGEGSSICFGRVRGESGDAKETGSAVEEITSGGARGHGGIILGRGVAPVDTLLYKVVYEKHPPCICQPGIAADFPGRSFYDGAFRAQHTAVGV